MLSTTPIAVVSTRQLEPACGTDPGVICRRVLESTHDRTLAAVADFVVGKPLSIEGIEIPFPQQTVWHRRGEDAAVGDAVPGRA